MRKTSTLVLFVILAVLTASCSSDSESQQIASLESETQSASADSDATGTDPIADTEEAMLAFTQCLRDEGIDIADPTVDADGNVRFGPIGSDSGVGVADPEEHMAEMDDAFEACGEHMEGVVTGPSDLDFTELEDGILAYAQCMRDNGIDMADPDFSGGGAAVELGSLNDEEFQAADAQCRQHMAFPGLDE
ncbi:MAG: hypothetical protein ABFS21_12570 [Actinomycetota bacterium]